MPYLFQDARASFSSILALRLMAGIIATSYWCSRCCHSFVPLLVTLTYSSKTVRQRIVHIRRSTRAPSAWNSKIHCSRLMASKVQIVLILAPRIMRCYAGLCLSDASSRRDRSEAAIWLTHGTDCRRVSLMILTTNGGRGLELAWRKKEYILKICCNNLSWTRFVVRLNLCFRLCNNMPNVLA